MSTTSKLYTFHELMTDGILMENEGKKMRRKVGRILIPMIQRPTHKEERASRAFEINSYKIFLMLWKTIVQRS